MGMEEKQREDGYWQAFAETGTFPALPEDVLAEKGTAYVQSVLKGQYNQLTKVLFAEVLGRASGFSEEIRAAQVEAAKWMRPMIFSKKKMYERRKEMASSFDNFLESSQNPDMIKMRENIDIERRLREWPMRAKALYDPKGSLDVVKVCALVNELNANPSAYKTIREDGILRNFVLFWVSVFFGKLRKQGNGLGNDLSEAFLRMLRMDGLDNLPAACWERKTLETKPAKGKDYFPATVEKLVAGLYRLVTDRYGRRNALSEDENGIVDWTIENLKRTYERLDDEWGSFRIGKLLLLQNKIDEAKALLLPKIRQQQSKFWVWDMLGHLFPERRRACLAKSLLCHEDEPVMLSRVRKEATAIGLPTEDEEALREIAISADDLLWEGLSYVKGVYDSAFENKDGKIRVRFILESGVNVKPVSPASVKLPRGLPLGTPVNVYLDPVDTSRILRVRLRESSLWDILPVANMTYYGKSQKGRAMLTFSDADITCSFDDFPALRNVAVGDVVVARYSSRACEYGTAYDVKTVELSAEKSTAIFAFKGPIRLPNGTDAPGFVGGVYVPRSLVFSLADQRIGEGKLVKGCAIRLAPRMEKDRFGVMRKKEKSNAISLEVLSGEELEQYKRDRGLE